MRRYDGAPRSATDHLDGLVQVLSRPHIEVGQTKDDRRVVVTALFSILAAPLVDEAQQAGMVAAFGLMISQSVLLRGDQVIE